jgi:hypothetical protein
VSSAAGLVKDVLLRRAYELETVPLTPPPRGDTDTPEERAMDMLVGQVVTELGPAVGNLSVRGAPAECRPAFTWQFVYEGMSCCLDRVCNSSSELDNIAGYPPLELALLPFWGPWQLHQLLLYNAYAVAIRKNADDLASRPRITHSNLRAAYQVPPTEYSYLVGFFPGVGSRDGES